MLMKKALIIFHLAIFSTLCMAQTETKSSVALLGRSYSDHIVLRYFATSPILFNLAYKVGYTVEKAVYTEGVAPEKLNYFPIKGSPFIRWKDDLWMTAFKNLSKADSVELKLAGLAMTISDPNVKPTPGDMMKDGLKSLRDQLDDADMKYAFALVAAGRSILAAEGLAIRVTDNEVDQSKIYVYRVRINQPVADPKNDWTYLKIKCENFNEKYLKNDTVVKLVEGDKSISFSFPESDTYYAFNVERSDDNGGTFKKITTTPSIKLKPHGYTGKSDYGFSDPNLTNYKKYRYRVLVSTLFADELVLSEFNAMPRDKTPPPAPAFKSANHIKPGQVELKWEMNPKITSDLKGFTIKRSDKEDGNYTTISKGLLPVNAESYIDETFDKEGLNYYVVEAVDTAGNKSQSFPAYVTLIDSIPPAVPVIASAKIDSLGKITIKIKPNTEKDFMGYQLQKANAKEHDFSVVLETFKDSLGSSTFILYDSTTLKTLTKKIFYKVIAFDTHFNQSEASKIIELTKRDTIPPVSPLITGFNITDTTVVITFVNSASEDAIRNILLRREVGVIKYDTIFSNGNTLVTRFIDKKIVGGKQYEYAMMAKDDGGLSSKMSGSIQLKTLLNNRIPAPILKGSYDAKTKQVSLSFVVDDKLKNRKLKVEIRKRSDLKSGWVIYKSVDFEKDKPVMDAPSNGQVELFYIVRLIDENKNSSNSSNVVELKF
jgi:hypothetical protein